MDAKKGILVICLLTVCIGIFWNIGRLSLKSNSETHYHLIHIADHAHVVSELLEKIDLKIF